MGLLLSLFASFPKDGASSSRGLGTIPNRMESLRKLIKKLGPVKKLRVCYGRLSDTEIEPRCHRIELSQGNKGLLETRIGSIGEDLGVERCSV